MLRSASKIIGHRLHAVDGEIGRATDFLLDERGWFLRYMVVETGRWLANRRVLISPMGLSKAEWTSRRLVLEGTREQVKNAPVLAEDGALPHQHEIELSRHYGWSLSGFGALPPSGETTPVPELSPAPPAEPGLHSITEALGFALNATDGSVGHVEDFIVDDDTWTLPYLVVDSRNWLSGRKVLVPTERVGQIDWVDRRVDVLLPSWEIEESPEFDPTAPVYERRDEQLVGDHPGAARAEPGASFFRFNPPESWRTRGLRAALARIIHG
jgi:hypothetical protein